MAFALDGAVSRLLTGYEALFLREPARLSQTAERVREVMQWALVAYIVSWWVPIPGIDLLRNASFKTFCGCAAIELLVLKPAYEALARLQLYESRGYELMVLHVYIFSGDPEFQETARQASQSLAAAQGSYTFMLWGGIHTIPRETAHALVRRYNPA